MRYFRDANGNYYALDEATGETYQYFFDSSDLGELSGFWSKVGNALKKTGKWIGKNVVPGVAGALTTYYVANATAQQQTVSENPPPTTPAATNTSVGFSGTTLLIFGLVAALILTRR